MKNLILLGLVIAATSFAKAECTPDDAPHFDSILNQVEYCSVYGSSFKDNYRASLFCINKSGESLPVLTLMCKEEGNVGFGNIRFLKYMNDKNFKLISTFPESASTDHMVFRK
jgi:hypothetical protein